MVWLQCCRKEWSLPQCLSSQIMIVLCLSSNYVLRFWEMSICTDLSTVNACMFALEELIHKSFFKAMQNAKRRKSGFLSYSWWILNISQLDFKYRADIFSKRVLLLFRLVVPFLMPLSQNTFKPSPDHRLTALVWFLKWPKVACRCWSHCSSLWMKSQS